MKWIKVFMCVVAVLLLLETFSFAQVKAGEAEKAEVFVQLGHSDGVNSVSFSPDGKMALSGSIMDETLKLWDVKTGEEIRTFKGHSDYGETAEKVWHGNCF